MKAMILTVNDESLLQLIEDLPGWRNLQIRHLRAVNAGTNREIHFYNVYLTKKQVAELGASKIKETYRAIEYRPFTGETKDDE